LKKGPLIAAGAHWLIGILMIIFGSIYYIQGTWSDWLLWFGLIIFGLGLIVLVTGFVKKPSAEPIEDQSSG
jgi:protein-S-isoprenylcysteine O-methyltransferase Ste14